jgi:divalent metal cation (Fe/Co/Zn/Cd) transporter
MGLIHNHSHHVHDAKQRVAMLSLLASAGLSLLKFFAALWTGSLGLLSEAWSILAQRP